MKQRDLAIISCFIIFVFVFSLVFLIILPSLFEYHPQQPVGPLWSARTASNLCKNQFKLDDYQMIISPVAVDDLKSGPCAWKGEDAGKANSWSFVFEGIGKKNDSMVFLRLVCDINARNGIASYSLNLTSSPLSQSDLKNTTDSISYRNISKYLDLLDSPQIYQNAKQQQHTPNHAVIESVRMLLHWSVQPKWTVSWDYASETFSLSEPSFNSPYRLFVDAETGNVTNHR